MDLEFDAADLAYQEAQRKKDQLVKSLFRAVDGMKPVEMYVDLQVLDWNTLEDLEYKIEKEISWKCSPTERNWGAWHTYLREQIKIIRHYRNDMYTDEIPL